MERRMGSESVLTIPKKTPVRATSMRGRPRANKGSGSGGKRRKLRAQNISSSTALIQHHHTKPEQSGVENVEWELYHPSLQARWLQREQKVACKEGHVEKE
jgi:hypothetical protein